MHASPKKRILLIEDDRHIAEGLKLNLNLRGYEVEMATDGVEGLEKWKARQPHLIVLDIMLPGMDGFSVLEHIRLEDERLPILILSARGDSADRVRGLAGGVDDYLTKPFNLEEFLLRTERLLTRTSWLDQNTASRDDAQRVPQIYRFGCNSIDFNTSSAQVRKGRISLTPQEAKLLKLFIANRGLPLSRKRILETGWGYRGIIKSRTVDNFIVRFRKYFEENPKRPVFFKSLRSLGYLFNHDDP